MQLNTALFWITLNTISLVALAFYSMVEMACVSFNKIRLQYYVSMGMKRAIWLNYLIQNPARLFGTTLLGVNVAMFMGSECSREAYIALGLDPDFAPLTQVVIVVIFAELAPMFAARRFAEHVAMLGAPILYVTAKILTPALWTIGAISKFIDYLMGGGNEQKNVVLNQEELQKLLALQDDDLASDSAGDDLNHITRNIFSLRHKDAKQIMQPISSVASLPSNATVGQMKTLISKNDADWVLLYHRDISHVVGIGYPRDMIRISDSKRVREFATPPWFIPQNTLAMQILKEFRRSQRGLAIVLNEQGLAIGMITLDDLSEEIFGEFGAGSLKKDKTSPQLIIDRTFPSEMTVSEFNSQFGVKLTDNPEAKDLTLAELMEEALGHHPEVGESLYLPPFELTVKETSLTDIKKVSITTRIK